MNIVLKVVNFILFRGLNHHQVCRLFFQTETLYEDLLYFYNVCWLNRGDMLQRVHMLREEIAAFLENINMNATEFGNQKWVSNLAFLVDLTSQKPEYAASVKAPIDT